MVEALRGTFQAALFEYCPGCVTSCMDPDVVVPGVPPSEITQMGGKDGVSLGGGDHGGR